MRFEKHHLQSQIPTEAATRHSRSHCQATTIDGEQLGMQEGKQLGLQEMAMRLLQAGVDEATIRAAAQMSAKELAALKRKLKN